MGRLSAFFLISIFFITSCSKGRIPTSINQKEIEADQLLLKRRSKNYEGKFQGLREKGQRKEYELTGCSFTYEKGSDVYNKNQKDYKFERFMIYFSGINAEGETSFDSVSYTNADYFEGFKSWDFSKSFGPVFLKSYIRFGSNENNGRLKFERGTNKEAIMYFDHYDAFDTSNSSFFQAGEKREYKVELFFSDYTPKKIQLKQARVMITSRLPRKPAEVVADIKCSNFDVEEEEQ